MADALSDILTLTNAFGQFTNSVVQLHDTRVQVETASKAALINKANYDFMQRFNLNPGDPNRISLDEGDPNYWRTQLESHNQQVEGFLGSVKDKNIQNGVRQQLAGSTQNFALQLSNVLAGAEVKRTQESFEVGLQAKLSMGDLDGVVSDWEMAKRIQMYSPVQEAEIYKKYVLPVYASKVATAAKGKPENAQDLNMALSDIRKQSPSAETPGDQLQRAATMISQELTANKEAFDPVWKALWTDPMDKNLHTPESMLNAMQELQALEGKIPEGDMQIKKQDLAMGMTKITSMQAEEYVNILAEMYPEGTMPDSVYKQQVAHLNDMRSGQTSEYTSAEISQQISRLNVMRMDPASDRAKNMDTTKYQQLYIGVSQAMQSAKTLTSKTSLANLMNEYMDVAASTGNTALANTIRGDMDKFLKENAELVGFTTAMTPGNIRNIVSLQAGAMGISDKAVKEWIDKKDTPASRVFDLVLSQAVGTVNALQASKPLTGPQATEELTQAVRLAVTNLALADNLKTGIFTNEQEQLSTIQGIIDRGDLAGFSYRDVFDNAGNQTFAEGQVGKVRDYFDRTIARQIEAKIIPYAKAQLIPIQTAGQDRFYISPDKTKIYAEDSIGGKLVIRSADYSELPANFNAMNDSQKANALRTVSSWDILRTPGESVRQENASLTAGGGLIGNTIAALTGGANQGALTALSAKASATITQYSRPGMGYVVANDPAVAKQVARAKEFKAWEESRNTAEKAFKNRYTAPPKDSNGQALYSDQDWKSMDGFARAKVYKQDISQWLDVDQWSDIK